jgi:hypothetical protein
MSAEGTRRLTVSEAAHVLGISTGAVRKRLSRGTLKGVKEGGTTYVLIPPNMLRTVANGGTEVARDSAALLSAKEETIRVLREQLEAERVAGSEWRQIVITATGAHGTEQAETPSGYQPEPGFLPPLIDRLPWWQYLLPLAVIAASNTIFALQGQVEFLRFIPAETSMILLWSLFAFWVGLRQRRFPWLMCIVVSLLAMATIVITQDLPETIFDAISSGDRDLLSWAYWVMRIRQAPLLVLFWQFALMFLAGFLLERVMNSIRNGIGMRETEIARKPS